MTKSVGLIGGCLIAGYEGVSRNELFYRLLRARLKEEGRSLHVKLAAFGDFPHPDYVAPSAGIEALAEANQKVAVLIGKGVDAIVISLRPSLHWALCKPLSRYKDRLYLHPALGGSNRPVGGYWLARILNKAHAVAFAASGSRLALYRQADRLLEDALLNIQSSCAARGVPLFVLCLYSRFHGRRYEKHVRKLYEQLEAGPLAGAVWVSPDITPADFCQDDFHMNADGHRKIAGALYPKLVGTLFR